MKSIPKKETMRLREVWKRSRRVDYCRSFLNWRSWFIVRVCIHSKEDFCFRYYCWTTLNHCYFFHSLFLEYRFYTFRLAHMADRDPIVPPCLRLWPPTRLHVRQETIVLRTVTTPLTIAMMSPPMKLNIAIMARPIARKTSAMQLTTAPIFDYDGDWCDMIILVLCFVELRDFWWWFNLLEERS